MSRRATSHDQLFKDLFRCFFDQLIELVAPELVKELNLKEVQFLEQEGFTDTPEGRREIADLVAEVPTIRGDPRLILIHGEIESTFRTRTEERLWRYSMHLILKHQKDVVTLVVYLKSLLSNLVETYVKLDKDEQKIFEERLETLAEREEVQTMQMTWAEEIEQKGILKGIEQGIQKGRLEGMQEGIRTVLTQQLELRFGSLPPAVLERLRQLDDPADLRRLSEQILEARSLGDLDL